MTREKEPPLDPNLVLCQVLEDLLYVIIETLRTKPADQRVWDALGRLDATRRQLQRSCGQEPTEIKDTRGLVSYAK